MPGKKSGKRASVEEVAEKTLRVLKECVPAAVPGIAFLSGGQSDEDATAHLDAMNKMGPLPWHVSFSYGRALQAAPQKTWSGKSGKRRGRATRLQPPRHDERPRRARPMESRPGTESGVTRDSGISPLRSGESTAAVEAALQDAAIVAYPRSLRSHPDGYRTQ